MIQDFIIPFTTILLAEMGDKTQLAIFSLSSKTKKYFQLLIGIVLAFVIVDGLAIILGEYITNIIPQAHLKIISGAIFIIIGIFTLKKGKEKEKKYRLKNPLLSGFGMILISELGDKSQISSGMFATQYNAALVFLGVISALTIFSMITIYLGKTIFKRINQEIVSYIAGTIFIIIGVLCFF